MSFPSEIDRVRRPLKKPRVVTIDSDTRCEFRVAAKVDAGAQLDEDQVRKVFESCVAMVVLRTKDGVIEFSDDGRALEVFDDIDFS